MASKSLLTAFVLAASMFAAHGQARAQPKYAVSQVVATTSFAFLPVYVAEHMGYFAEEGVDLKTVVAATSQAGLAMVASGNAAYYLTSPVAGARAAAQGARMLNCGALMTQNPTNVVVSAAVAKKHHLSDVSRLSIDQRMALLKGLRLAAHTPGSSPDLALKFMLQRSGLDPERDVQILPITQSAILAALERDRIDGFAYSSPLADAAVLRYGAVKLISLAAGDFAPLAGQLSITMACNRDWVEKQPDAAAAVLRAIWRGMKLMKSDPAQAKAAARKAFPSLEDAVFNVAFDTNLNAFPDNPAISREQMEAALAYHAKTGGTPISVKVEDTYTNAAVERAAQGMK
jgi:NitT/TauT family transport system substrate-binding protein